MKDHTVNTPNTRNETGSRLPKRQIQSSTLMRGDDQIEIVHRDQVYHLRVTRQGKLILTK